MRIFPTWFTIIVGTYSSYEEVKAVLEIQGNKISWWASDILTETPLTLDKKVLELVKISIKELTGKDRATLAEICQAAKESGLKLCSAEVGLYLRVQYQNQPYGELLIVAMEPITGSGGSLDVFIVAHDLDGRWLDTYCGNPRSILGYSNCQLVFCK
jgi:hypothetical protein